MNQTIITTEEDLQQVILRAQATDAVALDTEFVWERTFYPRLGLIQLALSDEECCLIDPVALPDLALLGQLLASPGVVKIFHDARQDLSILSRATGATPCNIFDSRLAAGFASSPPTLSLGNLVEELLQIHLEKSETRTNWLKRPLTEKQVAYALDDVRYLRAVRAVLLARLTDQQVRNWLEEEMEQFDCPQRYNTFLPTDRSRRIKGRHHLSAKGREVLVRLAAWREETARLRDRPRSHILPDAVLLELCNALPASRDQLKKTAISPNALQRYGESLLELLQKWRDEGEPVLRGEKPPKKLTRKEERLLKELHRWIEKRGKACGVAPALLGNSAELKKFVRAVAAARPLDKLPQQQGWRKEFLEGFLEERTQQMPAPQPPSSTT